MPVEWPFCAESLGLMVVWPKSSPHKRLYINSTKSLQGLNGYTIKMLILQWKDN